MTDAEAPKYISLSVTVLVDQRERLETLAAADYSNPSVIVRRILADYFARLDGTDRKPARKNAAAEKVAAA